MKVARFPTYSTMEVVGLDPAPGTDVQTLLWDPVPMKVATTVGGWPNGHLAYGFARLVNGVYRQLASKDGFVTECGNLSSNTWDAQSRAGWGEIGVADYAQIIRSNVFYRANYLPGMLGQQALSGSSSLRTIEATMARAASLDAGINFETSVKSLASGSNTPAVLQAIKLWESARNHGAFTAEEKKLLADGSTYWHLEEVAPGQEWSLQQLDADGKPVGEPRPVKAPAPGFTTPQPPNAQLGKLYEFKVTSSTPQTIRYEITSGRLPAGLALNQDTGTAEPRRRQQ